ncbi:hypothetical protein Tco_0854590 [Tanacetum coccineum]
MCPQGREHRKQEIEYKKSRLLLYENMPYCLEEKDTLFRLQKSIRCIWVESLIRLSAYLKTYDELTEKELKQVKADDQAIQTNLLGLPEKIYAIVDSEKKDKLFNECERFTSTDRESIESYYHCFSKLMNDFKRKKHFPEKIANNLKFLNNLQLEWSRHVTIVH